MMIKNEGPAQKLFLVLELLDLFLPHESLISEEELGIQQFVFGRDLLI